MTLADLGAEIIKVENPDGGDETRAFLPPEVAGLSTYFLSINRSKKSLALDLRRPEGAEAIRRLMPKIDVVIENFRTGVMERLGVGYDDLVNIKPELIYCSITGYGRSGRYAKRGGFDPILQAETGLMSITGESDGEPMRTGVAIVDLAAGTNASQAILAALIARSNGAGGQRIDVSLFESGLNLLANFAGGYLIGGTDPAMSLSLLKFVGQASLVDDAMLPS